SARPGARRPMRADMRLRELSLRQDPDLRQELASLARGCDFVLPSRFKKRLKAFQQVQTRKEEPRPPASSEIIPTFYFPRGRPQDTVSVDAVIAKIERVFAQFPHERATMEDMGRVAKVGAPRASGTGFLRRVHRLVAQILAHTQGCGRTRVTLQNCHDDAAKFVHLLMSPGCNYLVQEDFVPFLQDVVNTHPGLAFLKEASEFHSRYITTVSTWPGRLPLDPALPSLGRVGFGWQNVALLEEEADINQLTEYFSYEHFYVIYCKFWELDTDHDLLIDAQDLARHNDHAISTKMIERIFSGAVTRYVSRPALPAAVARSVSWVPFSHSLPDRPPPQHREPSCVCCVQLRQSAGLCHVFQGKSWRVPASCPRKRPGVTSAHVPRPAGKITLHDLKKCKLAHVFFDTFFNIEKYLDHEQKEQVSLLRESESEGPELSDWEKYAAEEYDILVAEEAAGEPWEDGYEAELSPVDQKLGALRSPLAQRPFFEAPSALGTVDLYEYACDDALEPS
ncbi:P2R3B phosphatase, partial [Crocuta crocuta]